MKRIGKIFIFYVALTISFLLLRIIIENNIASLNKMLVATRDLAVFTDITDTSLADNKIVDIIQEGERVKMIRITGEEDWVYCEVELSNGKKGYIRDWDLKRAPGIVWRIIDFLFF